MQRAAAAATSPQQSGALPSLSGVADLDGGAALLHGSASLDSDFLFGAGLVRALSRAACRTVGRARANAAGFRSCRASYRPLS